MLIHLSPTWLYVWYRRVAQSCFFTPTVMTPDTNHYSFTRLGQEKHFCVQCKENREPEHRNTELQEVGCNAYHLLSLIRLYSYACVAQSWFFSTSVLILVIFFFARLIAYLLQYCLYSSSHILTKKLNQIPIVTDLYSYYDKRTQDLMADKPGCIMWIFFGIYITTEKMLEDTTNLYFTSEL